MINVVHPRPVSWDHILKLINDALGAQLPMVPYGDWLAKLEALNQNPSSQILADFVSILSISHPTLMLMFM